MLKGRGKYIDCTQGMGSGKEKGVPQNVNNSYVVGTSIIGDFFLSVFLFFKISLILLFVNQEKI